MKFVDGGVCAPKGFTASGVHCGIRKNKDKKDLALIVSEKKAAAAAVYTTNLVKGAPLLVTKDNLADGFAQAIICNSGNANTCNANGVEIAKEMCSLVNGYTQLSENDVVVASTGVIGEPLDITPIKTSMKNLVKNLKNDCTEAAQAIMTTDTKEKICAVSFELDGVRCTLGGIAKGSGMINPNMATMLVFVTSDVNISPALLQKALSDDVKDTFNMISVDGDTSTNDMVCVLSNGMANNNEIAEENDDYYTFKKALNAVTKKLCRMIAGDGEGATKLIECTVSGAKTKEIAAVISKKVISSSLVKAAMFGSDANWGRVLCAIGYSGQAVDINKIDVSFKSVQGEIPVCKNGAGINFSEELAKKILLEDEVEILVSLNDGDKNATAWGCDLTYDYVKINGDYRT